MAKLNVNFCKVKFDNPFILPSGIITEIADHKRAVLAGVGGVTLKSISVEKRMGNPVPRVWSYDSGMINSVGLINHGIKIAEKEVEVFLKQNKKIPVIVSLVGWKTSEFIKLTEKIAVHKPKFIELNLSCPNVEDEFGKPFAMEKKASAKIVKEVKKYAGKVPVLAKLTPNAANIADIAKGCEDAGADGIVAINTVGPGMLIDVVRKKPVLGAKKGGVSGPGILPIAVRCVYEIYEAVKIPIIGVGGVSKWQDAVQLMLAGATLVGVGTATYTKGIGVFGELQNGLREYLRINKYPNVKKIVGLAHKK